MFFHLPFSPAAAKSLQSCPTLCDPIDSSPPGSRPWDYPGKNIGVGCHFLFQCMKVKSECEVAQSCPTLSDPMDCRLPGSSVHGISQARVLEWGSIAFSTLLSYSPLFFFFFFFFCFLSLFQLFPVWVGSSSPIFIHSTSHFYNCSSKSPPSSTHSWTIQVF